MSPSRMVPLLRIARVAAAVTLATPALLVLPAAPAAAGGYCLTARDGVPVHAEPRTTSRVVHFFPKAGRHFECADHGAWWRATSEDRLWTGFVQASVAVENSG